MGRRNFVKNNYDNSDNFGEQSLFYNYYDDSLGTLYTADETSADAKFAYRIIPCDSGLDVFEKYKSAEIVPESNQILIFVEKENPFKSNFFGTACRVKMGEARKELMWRLYDREVKISVYDDINLARSLEEWAEDIAYYNRNSAKAIDKTVLANAVKLELSDKTDAGNIFNTLLGLNNKLADWMRSGVAEMDTWKFTEENYEFAKYGEALKPLIPIPTKQNAADFYRTGKRAKNTIQNSGIERLSVLSEHLDQIVFTKAYVIARSSPTVHDDILFSMVWIIKEYLEKNFPESIKNLLSKTQEVITLAKFWILKIGKNAQESVALVNAFLCGIVNGLVSLLQMVIGLLAFVIDNISTFELEEFSKEKIAAQQEKLEFIEDLIDVAKKNIVELFKGIFHNLASVVRGIRNFIRSVGAELRQLSRYWWAFIAGSLALELIVDAVAAFFSGGTSLAAKIGSKVTRVTSELAKKGIKVTRVTAQRIATSSKSIYKYVKELFEEIIEAIKSGKFLEWFQQQVLKLFENTKGFYDNVLTLIGKTERIQKSKSGIKVLCFVNRRARVPVDKILKYCRGKVKDVEKFKSFNKELESLKAIQKSGKITKKQLKRLKFVQDEHHRITRSLEMKKILDDFGVPDNIEWNKKIINVFSDTANKSLGNKYGGIGNKEAVKVFFETPKGPILLDTKWEKIGYSKQWMNTIIIKILN